MSVEAKKQHWVTAEFDRSAAVYDRLVAANPGYHAHLRRSAARLRLPRKGAGLRILDLGCGTGASTAALLHVAPHADILAVSKAPDVYSSEENTALIRFKEGMPRESIEMQRIILLNMDPPQHTRMRGIVSRGFTPRAISNMRQVLAERAERGVEHPVRAPVPLQPLRRLGPPALGVGLPGGVGFGVAAGGNGLVHRGCSSLGGAGPSRRSVGQVPRRVQGAPAPP